MKAKIFILFIIAAAANLYAEAFFPGSVNSVNSDSGFNALRNPALMSRQDQDNFSQMYQYSFLNRSELDVELNFNGIQAVTDNTLSEDYNGALFLSGIVHSGKSSFGIGFSQTDDGQLVYSSSESEFQLSAYNVKSSEEKKFIGSTMMLSYSYEINNKESFGLQIDTVASYESSKTEKNANGVVSNLEVEQKRITSGLAIGYHYQENNIELGAVFKAGRHGIENQTYKLSENSDVIENKISNYYMNDDGLGSLLGAGIKPSRKVKVSFEGGYLAPYSHEEKECDDETLVQSTNDIAINYAYLVRGGINYKISRFIDSSFGGSYTGYSVTSSNDGVKKGEKDISLFQLTGMIDIRPSSDYILLLGVGYKMLKLDGKEEDSFIRYHMDLNQDYLQCIAGISWNYY